MSDTIIQRIRECQSLPTLPAAAVAVLQLSESAETSIKDLADVIAKDPALSSKVLRVVNSSFYNVEQKVSSIQQAATLLGLHSVRTLVLGFSLAGSMRGHRGGFNHLAYWRRTMYAATGARTIADRVLPQHAEDCFVAGLLMDLGTLLLDQILGEEYGAVYERAKSHADLPILETHAFRMTHGQASGVLAEHWKLPDVLRVPMTSHHSPRDVQAEPLRKVCEVIALAGRCADVFVAEDPAGVISSARKGFMALYQIEEEAADAILCEIGSKTAELASLFEVDINSVASYDAILQRASEQLFEISLGEKPSAPAEDVPKSADQPVQRKKASENVESEKRRTQRMKRDGGLTIIPCSRGILGKPLQSRLKDVSVTGLGLVMSQRLEAKCQFIIELPQPDGQVKSLLYEVVRSESSGGLTSIGAQLVAVLRPERHASKRPAAEIGQG